MRKVRHTPALLKAPLCALMTATAIFWGCQTPPDPTKELESLLATDREFAAASVARGASEAFREYLLEDALQLPANSMPIRGRENIYAEMKKGGEGYVLKWEPREGEVAASGDLGYTWGIYTVEVRSVEGRDGGQAKIRSGKYLNVWKKDDRGRWRVLVDTGNPNE
jgi:ketosteroid isomerase-like protein